MPAPSIPCVTLANMAAAQHVEAVSGFVRIFRGIVDDMIAAQGNDALICSSEVADWIERFDFIGNALSEKNDETIDVLRDGGVETVLCNGIIVARPTPIDPAPRVVRFAERSS